MSLTSVFEQLKHQNKTAFIPFITAGDGGLGTTLDLLFTLVDAGADIIELGVPFSDPMADGKVIQDSYQRALARGVSLQQVLDLVAKFRQKNTQTPIVLMSYANPIEVYGYEKFAKNAHLAGVDGVLIIDMPPEESVALKAVLRQYQIDLIFLIAPTTDEKRLKQLIGQVSGFAYFVALKGVTGAKNFDINSVRVHLNKIRQYITAPIGVGFGITDAKSASAVANIADAVIVGSRLVGVVEQYQHDQPALLKQVYQAASGIAKGIV